MGVRDNFCQFVEIVPDTFSDTSSAPPIAVTPGARAFVPARIRVALTRLINERTVGADRGLRPLQIVSGLKRQPIKGGGVEDEGKA